MAEVIEICPCGAEFRVSAVVLPEGVGSAITDFRNRHTACHRRVIPSELVRRLENAERRASDLQVVVDRIEGLVEQ